MQPSIWMRIFQVKRDIPGTERARALVIYDHTSASDDRPLPMPALRRLLPYDRYGDSWRLDHFRMHNAVEFPGAGHRAPSGAALVPTPANTDLCETPTIVDGKGPIALALRVIFFHRIVDYAQVQLPVDRAT